VARPQGGHSTGPFITQLTNNPYAGKSCTLQMHVVHKLKLSFEDKSNVWTPLHNNCNYSINGCRYTSTFLDATNSVLGMFKVNIKKYHLVTNQGGKL